MRVTPVSAYMAASNDGKLETLRAKNRPFQGSRMRGAAVQASRFDRCAQSLQTFFRSPPARQKLLRPPSKKSPSPRSKFNDGLAVFNRPDRRALEAIDGLTLSTRGRLEQA